MMQGIQRQLYLPIAIFLRLHGKGRIFLPTVEGAYDKYFLGIRSPFTQHPVLFCFMQTKVEVTFSKVSQGLSMILRQLFFLVQKMFMSSVNGIGERLQPRVVLNQVQGIHMLNISFF